MLIVLAAYHAASQCFADLVSEYRSGLQFLMSLHRSLPSKNSCVGTDTTLKIGLTTGRLFWFTTRIIFEVNRTHVYTRVVYRRWRKLIALYLCLCLRFAFRSLLWFIFPRRTTTLSCYWYVVYRPQWTTVLQRTNSNSDGTSSNYSRPLRLPYSSATSYNSGT